MTPDHTACYDLTAKSQVRLPVGKGDVERPSDTFLRTKGLTQQTTEHTVQEVTSIWGSGGGKSSQSPWVPSA